MKTALFKVDRNAQGALRALVSGIRQYREQQDIFISLASMAKLVPSVGPPVPLTDRDEENELDLGVAVHCSQDDVQQVFDVVNKSLKTQELRFAKAPTTPSAAKSQTGDNVVSVYNNITGEIVQLYIENSHLEIFKNNTDVVVHGDGETTTIKGEPSTAADRAFSLDDTPTLLDARGSFSQLSANSAGSQSLVFQFEVSRSGTLWLEASGLTVDQARDAMIAHAAMTKESTFTKLGEGEQASYNRAVLGLPFSLRTDATYFLFKKMGTVFLAAPSGSLDEKPFVKLHYVKQNANEGMLAVSTIDNIPVDQLWVVNRLHGLDAKLAQLDRSTSGQPIVRPLPNVTRLEISHGGYGIVGRFRLINGMIAAVVRERRVQINNDSRSYNAVVAAGLIQKPSKSRDAENGEGEECQ